MIDRKRKNILLKWAFILGAFIYVARFQTNLYSLPQFPSFAGHTSIELIVSDLPDSSISFDHTPVSSADAAIGLAENALIDYDPLLLFQPVSRALADIPHQQFLAIIRCIHYHSSDISPAVIA